MRIYTLLFLTIFIAACGGGGSDNSNTAVDKRTANTNTATTNTANGTLGTTKTPEAAATNNAPTLAPVVQNYYAALQKKDEAAVRKFLSAAALKYYEDDAKSEKKTWLVYLLESEEPLAERREVRNERIEGETAVAEIKGGSLGVFTPIKFVKENGEWKFASPKDSLESLQNIPKTAVVSNSAK